MNSRILELRELLQKKLKPARYEHSLSVSFTCVCLAMRYGYPLEQAELAGLMHDCAKSYRDDEIIALCETKGIAVTEAERKAPAVLHAKYGAWEAREQYEIQDSEILNAIACHTTGKPEMTILDKILYIADYIEVRRDKAANLTELRKLAFEDLDEALYQILAGSLKYLEAKGCFVDPMTRETFEYYDSQRREQ